MHTSVLKSTDVRFISLVIVVCLLLAAVTAQAAGSNQSVAGATEPAVKAGQRLSAQTAATATSSIMKWGPYLDVAFELTYWDRSEIKEWREKNEREIGETLAAYIAAWQAKLAGLPDTTGAAQTDNRLPLFQERDYLRLVAAQTIDYLQSGNQSSLNGAAQVLEKLKAKSAMPEIAFWTGFIMALQALENNDSPQFVARVYEIWNNAVLYAEQGAIAGNGSNADTGYTPFFYRNIVNLVVNRAIIERKLEDVNALGPLFLMLKERNLEEKEGEGRYLTTLVQRIAEGFVAPDSDRYRLNFTVAVIEAKRLQQLATAKLDSEGMSEEAQKLFEQARLFNDYALKWAASRRSSGVVSTVADYLDITSFAIQRLADNEKAPAYKYFAELPTQAGSSTLLKAMAIYNDLAVYADGGWEKAGYANRESYLKASHRLWRAIMELSLWSGDFYLAKLNAAVDQQKIFALAAPMQVVLDAYLEFLASQKSRGFPDVIPDSAYYGAAEAAEKLAYAFQKVHTFSTDNTAYNLWFFHRLQATELFPFDPREISQTASVLRRDGRYNLFLDYFLPLAGRIKNSPVVKAWLEEQKSDAAKTINDYLVSINDIYSPGLAGKSSEVKDTALSAFTASAKQLREELQRKPDHPVHKLLRAFYVEEMQKNTTYTLLLKDLSRLNQ